MAATATKQLHIRLEGAQIDDYQYARSVTGIQSDADLVRFLFRRFRLQGERALADQVEDVEDHLFVAAP